MPRDPKLEFTTYQHEMMEGLIFSDAYILYAPRFRLSFVQSESRMEYVEFIKKELKLDTKIGRTPNGGYSIQKGNIVFKEYRERWYPEGKKIIPKDFKLTPISGTHLYLGDGTYDNTWSSIRFCTNSFLKENVEEIFLPQLHKLGMKCWMQEHSHKYWLVYMPRKSANTFLEYIGPPPIKCFPQKYERNFINA